MSARYQAAIALSRMVISLGILLHLSGFSYEVSQP